MNDHNQGTGEHVKRLAQKVQRLTGQDLVFHTFYDEFDDITRCVMKIQDIVLGKGSGSSIKKAKGNAAYSFLKEERSIAAQYRVGMKRKREREQHSLENGETDDEVVQEHDESFT